MALLPGVSPTSGSPSDMPLDEHHRASYSGDFNGDRLALIVHSIRAATLGHGTPVQNARVLDQNIQPGNSVLNNSIPFGDLLTGDCHDADRPDPHANGCQWSPPASAVSYIW